MKSHRQRINQEILVASFSELEVCNILAQEAAKVSGFNINGSSKTTINLGKKEKPGMTGFEIFADIKVVNEFGEAE